MQSAKELQLDNSDGLEDGRGGATTEFRVRKTARGTLSWHRLDAENDGLGIWGWKHLRFGDDRAG